MKSRLARRRLKLWEEDPHCRRCGVITVLPPVTGVLRKPPKNQATIQHIHSRLDPKRGKTNDEATTLFCWQCNNDDNKEVQENTPIEILQERAGQGHREKDNVRSEDGDSDS